MNKFFKNKGITSAIGAVIAATVGFSGLVTIPQAANAITTSQYEENTNTTAGTETTTTGTEVANPKTKPAVTLGSIYTNPKSELLEIVITESATSLGLTPKPGVTEPDMSQLIVCKTSCNYNLLDMNDFYTKENYTFKRWRIDLQPRGSTAAEVITNITFGNYYTPTTDFKLDLARKSIVSASAEINQVRLTPEWVHNTHKYTVKFDANDGEGTLPKSVVGYAGQHIILPPNNFTKTVDGKIYSPNGWGLNPSTSVRYLSNTPFILPGDIHDELTLFAQTAKGGGPVTYKLGVEGAVLESFAPTRGMSYVPTATHPDSAMQLKEWKWVSNGYQYMGMVAPGTSYAVTDFEQSVSHELTAVWIGKPVLLTYNGNYNTSGDIPASVATTMNSKIRLAAGGNLAKDGYTFAGWTTTPNRGTIYTSNDDFTVGKELYATLYAKWRGDPQTVAYSGNGHTGGSVPTNKATESSAYFPLDDPGSLTKTGYTFKGWTLDAAGTGMLFVPGEEFVIAQAAAGTVTTFHAQWTANAQVVSYSGNGNTSGSVPAGQNVLSGSVVTLPASTVVSKSGYSLDGWALNAAGTGTVYNAGSSYTVPGNAVGTNTVFYAKWTGVPQTMVVNGVTITTKTGDVINLPKNGETGTVKFGYSFDGWALNAAGTGTLYNDTYTVPVAPSGTTTNFYPKWTPNAQTIKYLATDTGVTGLPSVRNTYSDESAALSSTIPVRSGYTFKGWTLNSAGTGKVYASGETFSTPPAALSTVNNFYAQWTANAQVLKYEANATGVTNLPAQLDTQSAAAINLSSLVPVKTGYEFLGWTLNSAGTGKVYASGEAYTVPIGEVGKTTLFYAKWQGSLQTITINGVTTSVRSAETISLPKNGETGGTKFGYVLDGWTLNSAGTGTIYKETYTMPDATAGTATTFYPKWIANSQKIVYIGNSTNVSGVPTEVNTQSDAAITLSNLTPVKAGYTFNGWTLNSAGTGKIYAPSEAYTVAANNIGTVTNFYGKWTANAQVLKYEANTTGVTNLPATVNTNSEAVLALSNLTPVKAGYTFNGWTLTADNSGKIYAPSESYTVTNAEVGKTTIFYGKWTANAQVLKYEANATGVTGVPAQVNTVSEAEITLSNLIPVKTGYEFLGWTLNSAGTGKIYAPSEAYTIPTMAVGTVNTFYGKWTANAQVLKYEANATGVTGVPTEINTQSDASITLSNLTPVKAGYTFNGWTLTADNSGKIYTPSEAYTIPAAEVGKATIFYGKWTANAQTIKYNSNATGVTGVPAQVNTVSEAEITLSNLIPVKAGYTFNGWTITAGADKVYTPGEAFVVPNAVVNTVNNFYAKWTANAQVLKYEANATNTTNLPEQLNTVSEADITLSSIVPVKTGYEFLGWTLNSAGTGKIYDSNEAYTVPLGEVGKTTTFYAKWDANAQIIKYNSNATGVTNLPEQLNTVSEAEITLSSIVPVKTGYAFAGWTIATDGSGKVYASKESFTIPADVAGTINNFYAKWVANAQIIKYNSNATGVTNVPEQSNTVSDAEITLSNTTPVKTGYEFLGWTIAADGSGKAYASNEVFKIPADVVGTINNFYAKWIGIEKEIVINGVKMKVRVGDKITLDKSLTKDGYYLAGWTTDEDNQGTVYTDSFEIPTTGDVNLYPKWVGLPQTVNAGGKVISTKTGDTVDLPTATDLGKSKYGYTFNGWNTLADGSGDAYTGSFLVPVAESGNVNTLHIQWLGNLQSIKFDDAIQARSGDSIKVPTTTITKVGYSFTGWSLDEAGKSKTYAPDEAYEIPAGDEGNTITFYHQWLGLEKEIVINGVKMKVRVGDKITLDKSLTKAGYSLVGWTTDSANEGTVYTDSFEIPATGDVNLYPKWVGLPQTVNAGGKIINAKTGDTVELPTAEELGKTKYGYTFAGWNTNADGSGDAYDKSFTVPVAESGNVNTLHIQWLGNLQSIKFDDAIQARSGDSIKVPTTKLKKRGYTLSGWSLDEAGKSKTYAPDEAYEIPAGDEGNTITFYHQWTANLEKVTYNTVLPLTSGVAPVAFTARVDETVKLFENTAYDSIGVSRYIFLGWTYTKDGVITKYKGGDSFVIPNDADGKGLEFKADWQFIPDPPEIPVPTYVPTPPGKPLVGPQVAIDYEIKDSVPSVALEEDGKRLTVDGPDMKVAIEVEQAAEIAPTTYEIQMYQNSLFTINGSGLEPGVEVQVYVFSKPRFLGTAIVDASGSFVMQSSVPHNMPIGKHTLQVGSSNVKRESVVTSFPVEILKYGKATSRSSFFAANNSILRTKGKVELKNWYKASLSKKKVDTITVGGFAGDMDIKLAARRAKVVIAYLKSLGVKSKIITTAKATKLRGIKAARVDIFAKYSTVIAKSNKIATITNVGGINIVK